MTKNAFLSGIGAALLALSAQVQAVPITFSFNTANSLTNSCQSVSGVTVCASSSKGNVTQSPTGLGVSGLGSDDINNQFNGTGRLQNTESLLFTFSGLVNLGSFYLNGVDVLDGVQLDWGTNDTTTGSLTRDPIGGSNLVQVDPVGDLIGNQFLFSAVGGYTNNPSDFRVYSLTVDVVPTSNSSVPEPSALLLSSLALLGLAFARRR